MITNSKGKYIDKSKQILTSLKIVMDYGFKTFL